jgi:hypothetical protein
VSQNIKKSFSLLPPIFNHYRTSPSTTNAVDVASFSLINLSSKIYIYRIMRSTTTATAAALLAALFVLDKSCMTLTTAYNLPDPKSSSSTPSTAKSSSNRHRQLFVQPSVSDLVMPRRSAFQGLLTGALGVATAVTGSLHPALAADADVAANAAAAANLQNVYFGVGCYLHNKQEFVMADKELLGRDVTRATSFTGYAGGKSTDSEGRVCYHNGQQTADYGKLGHGEAVGMQLPSDKIVDFAALYFSLFNPRTKGKYMCHVILYRLSTIS